MSGTRPTSIARTRRLMAISMAAIMLAMLVPMTAEPAEAAGESWLTGWDYRAAAPINAAAGAGTGYQVLFHLYAGTGTDTAGTHQGIPATIIYANGHAKADWGDLRFTAADGQTLLNYYVESSSSSEATVWVKLEADISTTGTTVYCYYGNAAATSQSNGAATFLFFDDFNGDLTKWPQTAGPGGTHALDGGVLTVSGNTWLQVYSSDKYGPGVAVRTRVQYPTGSYGQFGLVSTRDGNWYTSALMAAPISGGMQAYTGVSSAWSNMVTSPQVVPAGSWDTCEIMWPSGGNVKFYEGGSYMGAATSNVPTTPMYVGLSAANSQAISFDWLMVRKYVANEPTPSWPDLEFTSQPSVANIIKTVDGRTITASVAAENYSSIKWDMGDNTTYEGSTQVRHTYADNGTYTVTVTVSDWLGQNDTTSTAVQIGAVDNATVGLLEQYGAFIIADLGIGLVIAFALGFRRPVVLIAGIVLLVLAALLYAGILVVW